MAIGFNMKCVADTGDYRVKPEQAWPTSRRDSHFAWLRCRFKIQLGAAGRAHPLVCFLRARLSISSDRMSRNAQVDGEAFKGSVDGGDACSLFVTGSALLSFSFV